VKSWPPLIGADHQPAWVRLRDVLLTLLAWAALAWMLARPLALAWDFLFIDPVFTLSRHAPIDWRAKWLLLRPFAMAAAMLVVWVLVWALLRTRPLAARNAQPAPPPLALADHAGHWGLDPQAVAAWQAPRVAVARFDDAQRLLEVRPRRVEASE
jgi:poly-beta-1,6-N-acetyl-D-glucosamine biosynthesis protein PgaD